MVRDVLVKLDATDRTVCELGCGTGVLAVPIAEVAAKFVGIDVAEEAVRVLQDKFEAKRITVASAMVADGTGPLPSIGKFERVLIYGAMHLVDKPTEMLATATRIVVPGGKILIGSLPLSHSPFRPAPVRHVVGMCLRLIGLVERRRHPPPQGCPTIDRALTFDPSELKAWLDGDEHVGRWEWLRPGVGVPMFTTRGDLLITASSEAARPPNK